MYMYIYIYIYIYIYNQSIINQPIKSSKRHTSTREATSQRNHTGSKPRDAKRRAGLLGGLRASRASVSLRDSLYVYTLFTEARKKLPRKTTSDVSSYHLPNKEEERDPGP